MNTAAVLLSIALAAPALAGVPAPLHAAVWVEGLDKPVGFVQSPADPDVQFVIEQQTGKVRVIQNGALLPTPFLNIGPLLGAISGQQDRGLLGICFDPDYAATGRFWIGYTNNANDTVISRYRRSDADPLIADPASRFDLMLDGVGYVDQPYPTHNGGSMHFGADGFLYIIMGDGGNAGDPERRAQNPDTLLGKVLRIDARVPDNHPVGYTIPPGNPFLPANNPPVTGARPEIWAFGVRNPWRWSFDDFGPDATGAMLMADVGQQNWEEVNYQPAGLGGVNWGWRIREGAHNYRPDPPAAYEPLADPIHEYSHTIGLSITGGYVYRGASMCSHHGRYFFADFVFGKVWSFLLDNGQASDLRDHTIELFGGPQEEPFVSAFGRDARGDLYILQWIPGRIWKITSDDLPVPGDYAPDGAVNFADLNVVLSSFNNAYTFEDLNLVLGAYNTVCPN